MRCMSELSGPLRRDRPAHPSANKGKRVGWMRGCLDAWMPGCAAFVSSALSDFPAEKNGDADGTSGGTWPYPNKLGMHGGKRHSA
jgi:hypothetical protein